MLDNTQSIICAFGLAAAAPRSPYRHLELCGIALNKMAAKDKHSQSSKSESQSGTVVFGHLLWLFTAGQVHFYAGNISCSIPRPGSAGFYFAGGLLATVHCLQTVQNCGKLLTNITTIQFCRLTRQREDRAMDVRNSIDGSLQISNEVVAKIAKLAALEIDGVADVSSGSMQSVRGLLSKASLQKPVTVDLSDGVAVVQVHVIAKYGSKIMPVCAKVQENVKQTIQNMTGITVSRVDVIVAGLEEPAADQHK
ncbi:MAG: Asp23/Gls24 family envelope stress response protein [Subdoligranulum sp.]|nr:Asp23/Gls24 family envelope stress response protein [Subdoligranulum sp.]